MKFFVSILLFCIAFAQANKDNKGFAGDIFRDGVDLVPQEGIAGQDHVAALLHKYFAKGSALMVHYLKSQLQMFEHEQNNRLLQVVSLRAQKQKEVKAQLILRFMENLKRLLRQSNATI